MKINKKYITLSILLCCLSVMFAQSPANRTTTTIVADVLAQMPAQEKGRFNLLMEDLASTGEEGVIQLLSMVNPTGKGSNALVEYALNGLSSYVSTQGKEATRLVLSRAYLNALDKVNDSVFKAFIIGQLQIAGGDEAVSKLASLLSEEAFCDPAARALSAIHTKEAGRALLANLTLVQSNKSKKAIVSAIAEMQLEEAENELQTLIDTGDEELQKTVLYALSRVGSVASLKKMAECAKKEGYVTDKTEATASYIALIKRIEKQGYQKEAEKEAVDLMKKAEESGQTYLRIAALEILMHANPSKMYVRLQQALKDKERDYRFSALNIASEYANEEMYSKLLKLLPNADVDTKIDITGWFSQESENREKCKLLETFATDILINQLKDGSMELKAITVEVLAKTGGQKAILALSELLTSNEKEVVIMAEDALSYTKGDISTAIASVIANASEEGKIAGLDLLSIRRATRYADIVFAMLTSDSFNVRLAAYTALRNVVTSKDLNRLYPLLGNTNVKTVTLVQQALAVALSEYPANKQTAIIVMEMEKATQDKKHLYYSLLASTGDPEALRLISEEFGKEAGIAKDAAFQALLEWKGIEVAGQLYEICKDEHSTYSKQALNRYVELASAPEIPGEIRFKYLNKAMEQARTDVQKKAILISLGNTNTYQGMLLAGKYLEQRSVQEEAAQAIMKIALANKTFTGAHVERLLNTVISVLNNPDAEYQRQAIREHLASLVIPEPYVLISEEEKDGFRLLFDGTNLKQWTGNTVDYVVENGCISLYPNNTRERNLYTKEEFGNFIFRFEFQLTPAANNGIGIRTPMKGDAAYVGMELQVLDNEAPVYSKLAPYQYHGSVYGIIPAERGYLKPLGEWNEQEIVADGNHIKVTLNGVVILDGNIKEAAKNGNPDGKEHPGLFNAKGHIALLGHDSHVKFKHIRIKELK